MSKIIEMNVIRKYLYLHRPVIFPFSTNIFAGIFSILLKLMMPLLAVLLFDYAYPQKDLFVFVGVIVAGLGIYFLDSYFSMTYEYSLHIFNQRITTIFAEKLYEKILKMSVDEQYRWEVALLRKKLNVEAGISAGILVNLFQMIPLEIFRVILFFSIYIFVSPFIAILACLAIPIFIIERNFFAKKYTEAFKERAMAENQFNEYLDEKLTNLKTIKVFFKEHLEVNLFKKIRDKFRIAFQKVIFLSLISGVSNGTIYQIWRACLFGLLGYEVILGKISVGQLIALTAYIPLFEVALKKISDFYPSFKAGLNCLKRVDSMLSSREESFVFQDLKSASEQNIRKGKISFRKVSMAYDPTKPILEELNFEIPAHSSLAIVGESGTGKSSLFNLLIRFYKPTDGIVQIDGKDVKNIQLEDLRTHIGVVFQDISLFHATIRENILYGNPSASEEEMIECAKMASVHEYVTHLPCGYDTLVASRGVNISGGLQQRIALARALLLKPKILILDEATSELDAENEFLIRETLKRCQKYMTIIMIAHRLSSIKSFDQILVLEKGRISEKGTFSELMNKQGVFFKLYHLQFGGLEEFKRRLEIEFERHRRYNQDLCLNVMEIENYEEYLKTYGSLVMNRFMETIELCIRKNIRVMDFVSLYHLNKIVLGLPETDRKKSYILAQRLREKISQAPFKLDNLTFHVSISYGSASIKESKAENSEILWDRAIDDLRKKEVKAA